MVTVIVLAISAIITVIITIPTPRSTLVQVGLFEVSAMPSVIVDRIWHHELNDPNRLDHQYYSLFTRKVWQLRIEWGLPP